MHRYILQQGLLEHIRRQSAYPSIIQCMVFWFLGWDLGFFSDQLHLKKWLRCYLFPLLEWAQRLTFTQVQVGAGSEPCFMPRDTPLKAELQSVTDTGIRECHMSRVPEKSRW